MESSGGYRLRKGQWFSGLGDPVALLKNDFSRCFGEARLPEVKEGALWGKQKAKEGNTEDDTWRCQQGEKILTMGKPK